MVWEFVTEYDVSYISDTIAMINTSEAANLGNH